MIPQDALTIIKKLEEHDHEAYIVGGCVRDMILGRVPNDWDIATSASPEQVKKIFARTYDTGIAHGTVTVIVRKEHFEVTTYRTESEYEDFRRPNEVEFVKDIVEDLARRDFTMNAVAFHPKRGYVDPFGGQQDIELGIIRSVRKATERFSEDALRILRAVRFAAQLEFKIEDETLAAISVLKHLLAHISKERIRDEFTKICVASDMCGLKLVVELDLLPYISSTLASVLNADNLPLVDVETDFVFETLESETGEDAPLEPGNDAPLEPAELLSDAVLDVAKVHGDFVEDATPLRLMRAVSATPVMRYSALMCTITDAATARKVLQELKFDNESIKTVGLLVTAFRSKEALLATDFDVLVENNLVAEDIMAYADELLRVEAVRAAKYWTQLIVVRAQEMADCRKAINAASTECVTQCLLELFEKKGSEVLECTEGLRRAKSIGSRFVIKMMLRVMGTKLFGQFLGLLSVIEDVTEFEQLLSEIIASEECYAMRDLAVNGNDLIKLGVEGKEIGYKLERALVYVMVHPNHNTKVDLLKIV